MPKASLKIDRVVSGPLKGHCPFHKDTHKSLAVNPTIKKFYCFGCGRGGNADVFLKMWIDMLVANGKKE